MGAYIINLDEFKSMVTHQIALYVSAENVTYFDSFGVEYIPKEIRKFIRNENITTNIYRKQAHCSIMYRCFCVGFIDFLLKDKSLVEFTNLFYPNEYRKNN